MTLIIVNVVMCTLCSLSIRSWPRDYRLSRRAAWVGVVASGLGIVVNVIGLVLDGGLR